jgi:hypothetical protein
MKWPFKWICLLLISTLFLSVSSVFAAEKNKTLIQCDLTRSAIETAAGKVEGNKEASADLERARAALKYADDCHKAGKSMFGFGDISPETEKEIKLSVDIADLATATALSRVEVVRATAELDAIEKQFATVKAKLKLFEDRKAEMERLRLEVVACRKTSNELEIIKLEKATLASQIDQLTPERSRADKLKIEQLELTRKLDEMKAENARLSGLLEKQPPQPAIKK